MGIVYGKACGAEPEGNPEDEWDLVPELWQRDDQVRTGLN